MGLGWLASGDYPDRVPANQSSITITPTPITAIAPPESAPSEYALRQNYPNPFNPTTTIPFSLPSRSFVTLKIFDVMGRDVARIVSEEMPAGSYLKQWNASGLSSGMYFYRLQAGRYAETKRLVLLR